MSLYRYKVIGKNGTIQKGFLEASSSSELKKYIQDQGISLITYYRKIPFSVSKKLSLQILLDFCLHLEQFENAGISLRQSLESLYQIQKNAHFKRILREIINDIESGYLFSKALAKHIDIFDPVFIGLIAVGEKTGNFSFVLRQLIHHLKWKDEVHAQIYKALRYPLIMASVLGSVLILLMTFLVPELVQFIKSFAGDLPLSTSFLIYISNFFFKKNLYIIVILLLFLSCILICIFNLHPKGPTWKHFFLNSFPFLGSLRRRIELTYFCHIFSVMFQSGIGLMEALQTARKYLRHGRLFQALENVERLIKEGYSLSLAFQKAEVFPLILIQMIKIGEQSNSLPTTLFHVKNYLDTSLKRQIDHFVGLLEPLMIICLGSVMAGIIYATFLPLYNTLSVLDY